MLCINFRWQGAPVPSTVIAMFGFPTAIELSAGLWPKVLVRKGLVDQTGQALGAAGLKWKDFCRAPHSQPRPIKSQDPGRNTIYYRLCCVVIGCLNSRRKALKRCTSKAHKLLDQMELSTFEQRCKLFIRKFCIHGFNSMWIPLPVCLFTYVLICLLSIICL